MANKIMKTLTMGENIYEIYDESARTDIATLAQAKESGEFNGKDGEDGYTPIKGTDYFTEADKQEIINDVLDEIEIPSGGSSGGSAKEWELITNITTEENVNSISVNVPKDCEEFYVYCKGLVADSNAGYISLKINDSGASNAWNIVEVTGVLFNNNVRAVCFHVQRIGSFLKCEYSSSTLTINDGRGNSGNQSIGVWKDFNEEIEFLSFVAYTSQFVTGFNMIVYGR